MRRAFKLLLLSLLFAIMPAMPQRALADVNDFTVTNFSAVYQLSRDDPQGSLRISETIDVAFTDYNHGILRAIPETYGQSQLLPTVESVQRDGKSEMYSTYTSGHNLVLKIGNPNQTLTGQHSYLLIYSVKNVITFFSDHDELYWSTNGNQYTNGNQWSQPFDKVSAKVIPPSGLQFASTPAPLCYTGSFGSQENDCQIGMADGSVVAAASRSLAKGENMSFVIAIPKGYFSPPSMTEKVVTAVLTYASSAIYILAVVFILIRCYIIWRRYGKDYKKNKIIAPAFEPPKGMTPLMAGYVYNQNTTTKHLSAQLVDLAIRGFIKIVESDKKGLLKSKTDYQLVLKDQDTSQLTQQEKDLLMAIFNDLKAGTTVNLNDRKNKLFSTMQSITTSLAKDSVTAGYYEDQSGSRPKLTGYLVAVFGVTVIGHLHFRLSINDIDTSVKWWALVVAYVACLLSIIMAATMRRRSHMGVAIVEQLDGLKLYLSTAEKDRLKMLQSANAPLAENAHEPVRDVKLFEKLLPYAIIFGVEETWAAAFQDLYTQPPEWYGGNWTTFNALVLTEHLQSTMSTVNTAFTPPQSSGGSGFGGGGFSGGGGGGGGGGGW